MEVTFFNELDNQIDTILNIPEISSIVKSKFKMFKNNINKKEKEMMMWEEITHDECLRHFIRVKILPSLQSLLDNNKELMEKNKLLTVSNEEMKKIIEDVDTDINEENMKKFRSLNKQIILSNKKKENLEGAFELLNTLFSDFLKECKEYKEQT